MWGKPEPACVTMAEAQMPTAQTDHVSANRTLPGYRASLCVFCMQNIPLTSTLTFSLHHTHTLLFSSFYSYPDQTAPS
jgi:hypothetical protein